MASRHVCAGARNFSVPRVKQRKKKEFRYVGLKKQRPLLNDAIDTRLMKNLYSYNVEPTYEVPLNKSYRSVKRVLLPPTNPTLL